MKALWTASAALLIAGAIGCASTDTPPPTSAASPPRVVSITAPKPPEESGMSASEVARRLRDVHFDYNESRIRKEDKRTLADDAQVLMDNPNVTIVVEGHCDERGTTAYNLALGERRAEAVRRHLVALGVAESQLKTVSHGEEKPVCFSSSESCWRQNRRAHFSAR